MFGTLPNSQFSHFLKKFRGDSFFIDWRRSVGTCIVYDGPAIVLRALRKGRRGPWIASFEDGPNCKWVRSPP